MTYSHQTHWTHFQRRTRRGYRPGRLVGSDPGIPQVDSLARITSQFRRAWMGRPTAGQCCLFEVADPAPMDGRNKVFYSSYSLRDWPGVPRFAHELIDQSSLPVDAVQGETKVRIMPLLLLAAYHPAEGGMERVAELWGSLASHEPSGGLNYVRVFVYMTA